MLDELIALSRWLGEEQRGLAIIGEGNTSLRADAGTFWVKASGCHLGSITAEGFVRMDLGRVLALLTEAETDEQVNAGLAAAKADPGVVARPSIETVLHALCLDEGGAQVVGHTHPVPINAILCSRQHEALRQHLFPDSIVVCGAVPLLVPYADPGLPLARAVQTGLREHLAAYGEPPKTIYLQNHGLFALGQTCQEVRNITAMAVKSATVLLGTFALGGPRYLAERDVRRIDTRVDEILRRRGFAG